MTVGAFFSYAFAETLFFCEAICATEPVKSYCIVIVLPNMLTRRFFFTFSERQAAVKELQREIC